jgi:hypothetical protein
MTLYVCIYNNKTGVIEYPEELPYDTAEEIDWGNGWGKDRLNLECLSRGGSDYTPYSSTDKQFVWIAPVVTP